MMHLTVSSSLGACHPVKQVDQAMKRIKDVTRSSRPRTHVQRLKVGHTAGCSTLITFLS